MSSSNNNNKYIFTALIIVIIAILAFLDIINVKLVSILGIDIGIPEEIQQEPVGVIVSSVAPAGKDTIGNVILYVGGYAVDGDTSTAWSVSGSGVNESITLNYSLPIEVTKIAIVPGYSKNDPYKEINWFKEFRRVLQAKAEFDDGDPLMMYFQDSPEVQEFNVPKIKTSKIKITILNSTEDYGQWDRVAISEIMVTGINP